LSAAVTDLLDRCRAAGMSLAVEGALLCVDHECDLPPDLLEELRRHKPEIMAALSARVAPIIAPARWAPGSRGGEPAFEQPCPERRGLVECRGVRFLHFCVKCGRWGAYGYGVTGNNLGLWYCREHRPEADTFQNFPQSNRGTK
jgi:hypothetical protein